MMVSIKASHYDYYISSFISTHCPFCVMIFLNCHCEVEGLFLSDDSEEEAPIEGD